MIPRKDELLVPYLTNWNTRLATGYATYQLAQQQSERFGELFLPYQSAYQNMMTARGAGTRSKAQTELKNSTKAAVLAYARMLYAQVQLNGEVPDNLKALLGIEPRHGRSTPIPAPVLRPTMAVRGVNGWTISARITDGQVTGRTRKADGAVAAYVYYFVGPTYPSDPALWTFYGATTKSDLDIVLPNDVSGAASVWVCSAWANAKQETGPVSVPVMTYLQGGGVQAAAAGVRIAA